MPELDPITTDTRAALERVIRDPKAKPADIVKAAELLREAGALAAGVAVQDMNDAQLLAVARRGLVEGRGVPPEKGDPLAGAVAGSHATQCEPPYSPGGPADGTQRGPKGLQAPTLGPRPGPLPAEIAARPAIDPLS